MTDQPHILVIGGIATDLVVRVPQFPGAGETVPGCHFVCCAGGRGATQAIAAVRAGARASILARVGSDDFGQRMVVALRGQGIDTGAVLVSEGAATGTAWHLVDRNGENATVDAPGANYLLRCENLDEHIRLLEQADVVLVGLEAPQTVAAYAIAEARRRGIPTILHPAPPPREVDPGLWQADVVIANCEEIQRLSGEPADDVHAAKLAASALIARGASTVVVTLGRKGALAIHAEHLEHVPPFPVRTVDVTGAGDAFCGSFAAAWGRLGSERYSPQGLLEATRFAAAAGALACQKFGRQNSLPHLAEIERLLKRSC